MKKNGYTTVELLIVVAVFTIIYFVGVTSISYAFTDDELNNKYNDTINLIEVQAKVYAENNKEIFEEEEIVYIYVKDLIEQGYLVSDENGKITNPEQPDKDLNDLKIKLSKDGENIKSNIVKI